MPIHHTPMAFSRRRALLSSSHFLNFTKSFNSISSNASNRNTTLGIHVVHCPDVIGIVAKLLECIALRGANLHRVDVFVPENKQNFYSGSEFAFDPACWPRNVMDNDFMKFWKFFNAEKSIVRFLI